MAILIEKNIIINRPPEDVFAFISNYENDPKWRESAKEANYLTGGPQEIGSIVNYVALFMGQEVNSKTKITTYEPNKKVGFDIIEGMISGRAWREIKPVNGGTRLTSALEVELGGLFSFAGPLLKRRMQKQSEAELKNLKKLLEG